MNEWEWADLKTAAAEFTSSTFVAIPAYEYWLVANVGEINTFAVPDRPPKMTFLGLERLGDYLDWLGRQSGVGQFNHPTYVTHDFKDYAGLTESRDAAMGMIRSTALLAEESFIKALDAGWHVCRRPTPTRRRQWIWGQDTRTVLLAEHLTANDLYAAMRAQRVRDLGQEPEHPLQRERRRDGLHLPRASKQPPEDTGRTSWSETTRKCVSTEISPTVARSSIAYRPLSRWTRTIAWTAKGHPARRGSSG